MVDTTIIILIQRFIQAQSSNEDLNTGVRFFPYFEGLQHLLIFENNSRDIQTIG